MSSAGGNGNTVRASAHSRRAFQLTQRCSVPCRQVRGWYHSQTCLPHTHPWNLDPGVLCGIVAFKRSVSSTDDAFANIVEAVGDMESHFGFILSEAKTSIGSHDRALRGNAVSVVDIRMIWNTDSPNNAIDETQRPCISLVCSVAAVDS